MKFSICLLGSLVGIASAKRCLNQTIPIKVSVRQGIFNIPAPQNNIDVTQFTLNLTRQGGNFTQQALSGYQTVSGTYQISTQFCVPSDNSTPSAVQILTHGIGFDKTYWDLAFNNFNYSYVNVATDEFKYATLSYDRLGIGNSSHGDPLSVIQAPIETAVLYQLTVLLRNGSFPGVSRPYGKVYHVGHSFGSGQTYTLVNQYPTASDGIVLTGFSVNSTFTPYFVAGSNFRLANTLYPERFGNASSPSQRLPNGYIITSGAAADVYNFDNPAFSDPAIVPFAEAGKQPVTYGELLTLGSLPRSNAFAGPVLVFTGDLDVPFCGGNCSATGNPSLPSIPAGVKLAFPNVAATNFSALIQPNTAHGLAIHYNATAGYRAIQNFLKQH